MSHSATLSPSPAGFMGPVPARFFSPARRYPTAPDNLERRRTSHPHNSYLQQRQSEDMPDDRSQPQQRPRLEHRASQTIIDLTDEPEEDAPPRNVQPRNRPARPPHLDRSDAVNLGDFIDLTEDSPEQDVIFTGERYVPALYARPGPGPQSRNARSVPAVVLRGQERSQSPSLFLPPVHQQPPPENRGLIGGLAGLGPMGLHNLLRPDMGFRHIPLEIINQLNAARNQAMPQGMNYQNAAFVEQKPEHVAPPPARSGFTRSPKEDLVLICPSCEEELIQNNEIEEQVVKKSGKAPTKKEREEHPFWVVKDCGHVYCNTCFQGRTSGKTGFMEIAKPKSKKTFTCAVEDCETDVRAKDKWVGVFL
ncbi:hypothetical protein WAI453_008288 [Rhynchosporium graminicola]|uniref:Cell cycle control protein n=1 Tax=Rhynchosporium graminicola TaxID=2792576 RepID=A0A1E1KMI8_9HELO|nr:uncharacterized protein RCO7_00528 [Rhynchosporium commune]